IFAAQLLNRGDAGAQARFVARGGVLVQRALLDGFVEYRHRFSVGLFGRRFIALCDDLPQFTQLSAQGRGVSAIARCATFGLAGALQRRKMICHVWFVTFVYSERYSGGSEFFIIKINPRLVNDSPAGFTPGGEFMYTSGIARCGSMTQKTRGFSR